MIARRTRARVEGTVQGVGFRPFVYRLTSELDLGGFVRNDERGVVIEVEGVPAAVDDFLRRLAVEAPPMARVERVVERDIPPTGERGFAIAQSRRGEAPDALVSPDTATCQDCLRELWDPADRRFRYPFVNCTNCGPRFTIVRGVPYDRPLTTMAGFAMCAECRREYEDPADRRFHAQPNACPACGPRLRLVGAQGDPLATAVAALRDGAIVAVKGLGGFHLACMAADEDAVAALRARKHREDKPFAVMVADVDAARALVELGAEEERLALDRARPIVLIARRRGAPVAAAVAPGIRELGLMLPYSPLHHLLLHDAGAALVMTSGNVSDEPIAHRDEDALARLAGIADLFLVHDRPIETRTDDSVVRVARGRPLVLRRSRGHVPGAIALPVEAPRPLLACGAELKSTFCLAGGRRAWVSHHVGDLADHATRTAFVEGVGHFRRLFGLTPRVVAHDLHPDYASTGYAREHEDAALVGVQHHHAHLAACLAEHGETGPAVGAVYDGAGLGTDGSIWGGELLVGDLTGFERAGHLWPVRLPGGDAAAREPWRMACAWLVAGGEPRPPLPPRLAGAVGADRWEAVTRLVHSGLAAPLTTSVGRLFDAVAALAGVRARVNYEGQAAVELEARAGDADEPYPFPVEGALLDARPTIRAVARDAAAGVDAGRVSARFHAALAAATAEACATVAAERRLETVVLSGGVFVNRRLLERTAALLEQRGLRVLVPERLPPGDGGISYGQAAVAAALDRAGAL